MRHSYAYYIRHGYGVFAIRNKREAKALYNFCSEQIVELLGRQPECQQPRLEVFEKTMDTYNNAFISKTPEKQVGLIKCHCGHCHGMYDSSDFWSYATDHARFYWS